MRNETRRFYDRISPVYDFIADSSEHEARELGLRLLAPSPGDRVLEIGCGTGHGLVGLMNAVGRQGSVYGVDISSGMLALARSQIMASGSRAHLAMSDARSLCFASNSFDAVFMSFTLELFDSAIPQVLNEVRRVLKQAGRIAVVALAEPQTPTTASHIYEWMHHHFPHLVDCRPIDVVGFLSTAGFDTLDVASTRIWTLPVTIVSGTPIV
jgi:demethylmenaquinone methyltransferase/2-methoxy-6-polyprenyl-1,4-benzoquinol methylase